MKLIRYGAPGVELPGLIDSRGVWRDLSGHVGDINALTLSPDSLEMLRNIDPNTLAEVSSDQRLGAPVTGVGKIVCIGLNYHDHAAEVGKSAPTEPMLFLKATSSLCGPFDPVEVPHGAEKTDWEVELAIVIGSRCKNADEATALACIAGYSTFNDVSERAFQSEMQGQFTKGKSHDTHGPLGPWLVTVDDVSDPGSLALWCDVDGVRMQDGSTSDMVFSVAQSISYISRFMTLDPGDLIATGTPAGVGKGKKPESIYLTPGQTLSCGVEGLGDQKHPLISVRP